MPLLKDPSAKYPRFKKLHLPNRQWPDREILKAPRWLATDLRDGNQALVDPMTGAQKTRYFRKLVELGYKEIEISYPSASQTDFDFTRSLIETPGMVPDDVWLQVLSPCREDLIKRTVESVKGTKKAIIHLYLATSPCFMQVVFGLNQEQVIDLTVKCTKYARSLSKDDPSTAGTEWAYEFSPEFFSDTDPAFAVKVCNAVKEAWSPSESNPIIFNLPATVEMSTPNVYADQIEYFCTHITEREKVCISLHPHNDRGCATAAAELAQMAGADRVEGVLFGNGERTGNVDLVTLGLNLYTQGIHPGIDFSDLASVIKLVEDTTKIPVHARAPYGGQLVVCAFSGSHQDAIKKGFGARKAANATDKDRWQVPYLPLDPQDIGRTYEAIIRVNSQSGKGGVAWVIQQGLELELPRGLQVAFSKIVQREADEVSRELRPSEIIRLFEDKYHLQSNPRFTLVEYKLSVVRATRGTAPSTASKDAPRRFEGTVALDGVEHQIEGTGNGPISSLADALRSGLRIELDVADYKEHAIGFGSHVKAATFIECVTKGQQDRVWGVGIREDATEASLMAMLSCASTFVMSRPNTPMPFRPKRVSGLPDPDAEEAAEVAALPPHGPAVNGSGTAVNGEPVPKAS